MITLSQRTQKMSPSYIREILNATQQPDMISFAGGLPDESLFPKQRLQDAAAKMLADTRCFQYGETQGDPKLREWIRNHQIPDTLEVIITTGSQQALDLIARAYLNPGDTVLVETPCYLGALQVFELAEASIITLPQTISGPDIEQLEQILQQHTPKLFYSVPDFHNPSGRCWSLETRQAVANLLNTYSTLFIEDAPYRALRYEGDHIAQVSDLTHAPTIRLGSFSKVATPGMRIGYAAGTATCIQPLILLKQAADLHSTLPIQRMMYHLLADGLLEEHLPRLVHHYREKGLVMAHMLRKTLGDRISLSDPVGGMFLWGELHGISAHALAKASLENGVAVVPGNVFYPSGHEGPEALRLNFTHASISMIEKGIKRLTHTVNML